MSGGGTGVVSSQAPGKQGHAIASPRCGYQELRHLPHEVPGAQQGIPGGAGGLIPHLPCFAGPNPMGELEQDTAPFHPALLAGACP